MSLEVVQSVKLEGFDGFTRIQFSCPSFVVHAEEEGYKITENQEARHFYHSNLTQNSVDKLSVDDFKLLQRYSFDQKTIGNIQFIQPFRYKNLTTYKNESYLLICTDGLVLHLFKEARQKADSTSLQLTAVFENYKLRDLKKPEDIKYCFDIQLRLKQQVLKERQTLQVFVCSQADAMHICYVDLHKQMVERLEEIQILPSSVNYRGAFSLILHKKYGVLACADRQVKIIDTKKKKIALNFKLHDATINQIELTLGPSNKMNQVLSVSEDGKLCVISLAGLKK